MKFNRKVFFTLMVAFCSLSLQAQWCFECPANNCDYCWDWSGGNGPLITTGSSSGSNFNDSSFGNYCNGSGCASNVNLGGGMFSECSMVVYLIASGGSPYCSCSASAVASCSGLTLGTFGVTGYATYMGSGSVQWRAVASYELMGLQTLTYHATDQGIVNFSPGCYQGCSY